MTSKTTEDAQDTVAAVPWAVLKKARRNTVKSVRVTLRGDLLDEVERLEAQMGVEREKDEWENRQPVVPQLARQIRELEDEARESEVEFIFEGMGRGEFAKLQAAHPVTDELTAEYGPGLEWNPDTFPPALMAASCISPPDLTGDLAEWTEIHQTWSNGQIARVWMACLAANSAVADTPKSGLASEVLRQLGSGNSSTTAYR